MASLSVGEEEDTLLLYSDIHTFDDNKSENPGSYDAVRSYLFNSMYTEEELGKLVEFVQQMTILYSLDHRDWNEKTSPTNLLFWKMNTNFGYIGSRFCRR
ncbi:hypothetical protein ACLKA6_000637 [Drosophila palustris]